MIVWVARVGGATMSNCHWCFEMRRQVWEGQDDADNSVSWKGE